MGTGFAAETGSIDGSAHSLVESVGLLYERRLERGIGTVAWTRAHPDVAATGQQFATFTDDQYISPSDR